MNLKKSRSGRKKQQWEPWLRRYTWSTLAASSVCWIVL